MPRKKTDELGESIKRLKSIIKKESGKDGNSQIVLKAQAQLSGLLAQVGSDAGPVVASESDKELSLVRSHLVPLKLAADDTPASELARLAVQRIVELTSAIPK